MVHGLDLIHDPYVFLVFVLRIRVPRVPTNELLNFSLKFLHTFFTNHLHEEVHESLPLFSFCVKFDLIRYFLYITVNIILQVFNSSKSQLN